MGTHTPLRWGILGTSRIALNKVVPALQASARHRVVAIASRDRNKADAAARAAGIERAYGSYDELIDAPGIDAIYNPLPNDSHVPWSIRAAAAGKHVLCEKPIALSAAEAEMLKAARDRAGVQIAEAFMVRVHPQWLAVRDLVRGGRAGEVRSIHGHFSYGRRAAEDIRSKMELGGGALMDIGCYLITMSRWLFGAEPIEVVADMTRDAASGVDLLTSGVLRFEGGQATFTASADMVPFQRFTVFGERQRVEIEVPFNVAPERRCRVLVDDGALLAGEGAEWIELPPVDQYALQADAFADAIEGHGEVPVTLEDSIANMRVIDAVVRSAASRRWEQP